MQNFDCLADDGKIIGTVSAINGDIAWELAKLAHGREVHRLRPTL